MDLARAITRRFGGVQAPIRGWGTIGANFPIRSAPEEGGSPANRLFARIERDRTSLFRTRADLRRCMRDLRAFFRNCGYPRPNFLDGPRIAELRGAGLEIPPRSGKVADTTAQCANVFEMMPRWLRMGVALFNRFAAQAELKASRRRHASCANADRTDRTGVSMPSPTPCRKNRHAGGSSHYRHRDISRFRKRRYE